MKIEINYRLLGVFLAFGAILMMPIYTLLTVVSYFLDVYGFPPIVPSLFKEYSWQLFVLIGATIPVYSLLLTFAWIGIQKYKNPSLEMKEELKRIINKIPEFFRKLAE